MIEIIKYLPIYGILGVSWAYWLETYTTKVLKAPYNQPWNMYERAYHIILWPYTFSVFIYSFLKEIYKNKQ